MYREDPVQNLIMKKYEDYDGLPVGTYTLNNKGNIVHWWSDELSKEEADIVNPFRPERFEGAFLKSHFVISQQVLQ